MVVRTLTEFTGQVQDHANGSSHHDIGLYLGRGGGGGGGGGGGWGDLVVVALRLPILSFCPRGG